MKRIITLCLILAPLACMAENIVNQDTTIVVGNRKIVIKETEEKIRVRIFEATWEGDTIENDQIFEGVYKDGRSMERRISVSIPFVNNKEKKHRGYFDKHVSGFYMGYSHFADGMNFSKVDDVDLVASKSWEWGINLFDGVIRLSRHWGLTSGLGFGYNSFRLEGNYGFEEINGVTGVYPSEDTDYGRSRLRYYHLRLPLSFEWQKKIRYHNYLFATLGVEIENRFWIRSKAIVDGGKQTLGKELNVRPLGINLLARAGYGDWGFYCRLATASLFEKDKGPAFYPYSVGIQWFW